MPTPVRVVDLAPGMARRDESEILVQRPDCAYEAYFVPPANADTVRKLLPPAYRIVMEASPQSMMGKEAPLPTPRMLSRPVASPASPPPPTHELATPIPNPAVPTLPPMGNEHASADGITVHFAPDHAPIGAGVRVSGSVAPSIRHANTVTLEFWPGSAHQSLGDKAHTAYTGPLSPAGWTLPLDANGRFDAVITLPRVIWAFNGEIWQILPGPHYFWLVVDPDHVAHVPFRVDAPSAPSNAPAPTTGFGHLWLADAQTGWLTGARCQEPLPPTPDANGNLPSAQPPQCQGLIERTTDGGHTWQTQDVGGISVSQIQFSGTNAGWAIGQQTDQCANETCRSALLRTTDGGQHWTPVYISTLRLAYLAFASPTDGWVFGQSCVGPSSAAACTWRLLTTGDGGQTWHESSLAFAGSALDVARPTASDGWIAYTAPRFASVRLLVTHDGGRTWQSLPSPVSGNSNGDFGMALRMFFLNPTEGWLLALGEPSGGFQPKELFHTNDGGKTWTKLAWTHTWDPKSSAQGLPDYGNILADGAMAFTTAQDGWVAMPRGGLLHSTDGGHTWRQVPLGDNTFTDLQFTNPSVGWVGGPDGLWATNDGGKTWRRLTVPAMKG